MLQSWCLPEFLPCWVCCSAGSSRRGKHPPHSAFSPSQPQCRWHRTSRSGHRRSCVQGKERVKSHCGLRQHPKCISILLLCKHEWLLSPRGRPDFSNLFAAPVGLVFCFFWPSSQLLLLNSALTAHHAAQPCYKSNYICIRNKKKKKENPRSMASRTLEIIKTSSMPSTFSR